MRSGLDVWAGLWNNVDQNHAQANLSALGKLMERGNWREMMKMM